jgi:circadian clock protein KaiC
MKKRLKDSGRDFKLVVPRPKFLKKKEKTVITKKKEREIPQEYIKTYISGFDKLFEHGIPKGNSVLIEGGPGSGKTNFCMQVTRNLCEEGKKVLYMSFEEPEVRLKSHMHAFGWHPEKYEKAGLLRIKRFSALDIARSVEALLSEAKKELLIDIQPVFFPQDFQPDIVCIDSLSSISSAFSGEETRFRIYMEQLFRYLEKSNITSFLIREVNNPTHIGTIYVEKGAEVSFLSDGIIVIYNVIYKNGRRGGAIEVLKMRGEPIDKKIVAMEIKRKKGIVVYPKQELNTKKEGYVLT